MPPASPRGIVRLLNTTGGRLLCLAGEVDEQAVDAFRQRYGREPVRVDRIETGSVTRLSAPALDLVLDHLAAAEQAGRAVTVHRSPHVERLVAEVRAGRSPWPAADPGGRQVAGPPDSSAAPAD